jgi:hypothetical protein
MTCKALLGKLLTRFTQHAQYKYLIEKLEHFEKLSIFVRTRYGGSSYQDPKESGSDQGT